MKILVIDNDINISGLLKSVLSLEPNYETVFALNGKDGLEKMKQESIDLVLVDFNMPELSGVDVCREMEKDEKLNHIPVIMVSAMPITTKDFQESHGNFQTIGVVKGLIEKPFDFHVLLNKIKEILNN